MSAYVKIISCQGPDPSQAERLRQLANALLHRLPGIALRDMRNSSKLEKLVGPLSPIRDESIYIDCERLIRMNSVTFEDVP